MLGPYITLGEETMGYPEPAPMNYPTDVAVGGIFTSPIRATIGCRFLNRSTAAGDVCGTGRRAFDRLC
jgi:hypothetical protein